MTGQCLHYYSYPSSDTKGLLFAVLTFKTLRSYNAYDHSYSTGTDHYNGAVSLEYCSPEAAIHITPYGLTTLSLHVNSLSCYGGH